MPSNTPASTQQIFSLRIVVNGKEISAAVNILSVSVERAVNQISQASIVIDETSDLTLFPSEADIQIYFEYEDTTNSAVFTGIITHQHISYKNGERLASIACHDKAISLALAPKSKSYNGKTANRIVDEVISFAGVDLDLIYQAGDEIYNEVNQANITDWDFLVAFAASQNHVLININQVLNIVKPKRARGLINLTFGETILDIEASIGDLFINSKPLAKGTVKSIGNLDADIGDSIRLKGISADFNGDAYIVAIQHVAEGGRWISSYDFGLDMGQIQSQSHVNSLFPYTTIGRLNTMTSYSGHSIAIDDENGVINVITAQGKQIMLDDANKSIHVQDSNGNQIVLSNHGLTLNSSENIEITAGKNITINAGLDIELIAGKNLVTNAIDTTTIKSDKLNLEASKILQVNSGASINMSASASTSITAGALLDLNSSGLTNIAGNLIQIIGGEITQIEQ